MNTTVKNNAENFMMKGDLIQKQKGGKFHP
jgi:ribosomal protein L27